MEDKDSIMISHPPFCSRKCGVCDKCYSKKMSGYRPNLREKQEQNSRVLKSAYFKPSKLNTVDNTLRWISTGELHNRRMYHNILRMVNHNDHITHQLWTKRAGLLKSVQKPDNLTLVWSATKINVKKPFIPAGFDIGFFVYSHYDKIPVNMPGIVHCHKKCAECGFCYEPGSKGIVAEVLK